MRYSCRDLDVVWENQDGETLLIDLRRGVYYSFLDGTALLLTLLLSGYTAQAACEFIHKEYKSFDLTLLKKQTKDLIKFLLADELVIEAPERKQETVALQDKRIDGFPEVERYDDMTEIFEMDPIHDGDLERGWPVQAG